MKENWKNYFKMGTIHFMSFPDTIKGEGPILETLEIIAKDDFFEAIEITWIKDEEVRKKAKDLLSSSGLEVCYGAQPPLLIQGLDVNSFDETERARAVKQIKDCVDEAEFMGIKKLALLSGPDPGAEKRSEGINILANSLKEICAYAKEKGIRVSLEAFDRDIDKKCIIGPSPDAKILAQIVKKNFPDFGILYDLSHLPLLKEDPVQALTTLGKNLTHVHIGSCVLKDENNPSYGDKHPPFGIPEGENGVEELRVFLGALFKAGYLRKNPRVKPIISFEVKPLPGQEPVVVLTQSKRVLEEAWRLL